MATRLVALSGPAGSGKSEVAKYLVEVCGYTLVKFAAPLKNMLRAYYHTIGLDPVEIERRIEGDLKEEPCEYLGGNTPRRAQQTLGTEWGRELMCGSFWIDAWAHKAKRVDGPVVVDDCRFENEALAVKDYGGEIVLLQPKVRRRKKSDHKAEAGLDPILADHTVKNDGTIIDLNQKVMLKLYPEAPETFGALW